MKIESSLDNQWIDFQRLKLANVAEGDITEPGRIGLEPNLVRLLSRGIRTESIAWLSDTLFVIEGIITGNSYPLTPSLGDKYIVNTLTPNPSWAIPFVELGDVVEYRASGWQIFLKVTEKGLGKIAYNKANEAPYLYKLSGWELFQTGPSQSGAKYTEDVTAVSFLSVGNLFQYAISFASHQIADPTIQAYTPTGNPISYGYQIDGSFNIIVETTIPNDTKFIIT